MDSAVEQMPQVKSEEPTVCGETSLNDFLGDLMDTGSHPTVQEADSKQRANLPSSNNCQFLIGGTVRTSPAFSVSDPSRLAPYKNCSSSSLHQHRGDPMLAAEQAGRRSAGSGRLHCKSGAAVFGGPAVSPEFHSTSGTPNSISQLLAAFSGSDNVALEFPSPLGSGFISPLSSAKLGRKRALSISPLSTGSLDLSNLIRSSPTSLLNYITASRGSSAGSIGHLSPSVFANPATPLRSHILKHTTQQQRSQLPASDRADPIPVELDVSKLKLEPVTASVDDSEFPGVYKDSLQTLATVREEEGGGFEEEDSHAMVHTRTVECDSTTAGIEGGNNNSCDEAPDPDPDPDPDHKAKRRVYYNYPNTEVPHHNQCLWNGCNVQYGTLDELVRHVNVDHIYRDSKKDFVCCWEGCVRERKAFKAQYMLLVHMRRHTGEKPHQCTFEGCNKAYSRLENLKTHLRSHTGEKPYTCKYKGCDKSFSNASDCAKHMNRTHSDEKPYACPNPGCSKRYTDPSSRRKHVKNCQVNKKPKAEDAMSGADEESCTEGTGTQSIPPPAKSKAAASVGKKQEKPNKKKKAETNHHNVKMGEVPTPMADHGYETGGSQGYVSSQTGYSSSGYDTEYPSLKDEDVHHAVLPRPFDHVTSPIRHVPNSHLPMNRPGVGHVVGCADKAARHHAMGTDPKRALPSYGEPPPATYHPYPLQVDPLLSSGCPPNDHQCVVHYTVPVGNVGGARHPQHPDQGPTYVTVSVQRRFGTDMMSSGYSSVQSFSPVAKSDPRLPTEDLPFSNGGHGVGFGLRNALMTNSRSTFSSTSSRTSTPSSNNGRGEVKPLPSLSEGQALPPQSPQLPTTSHRGHQHPWRQVSRAEEGLHLKCSMDERSERSWRSYSSHSSRYSVSGSELSDELLESLPATGGLRNTFAKAPPLPLPESMQTRPLPITSCAMDCGGTLDDFPALSGSFPPVSNDITLPLHHFGNEALSFEEEQCLFNDSMPISQSQLLLANGLLSDTFAGDAGSNMVIGDMASMTTALSCESRHYWEGLLQSAD